MKRKVCFANNSKVNDDDYETKIIPKTHTAEIMWKDKVHRFRDIGR